MISDDKLTEVSELAELCNDTNQGDVDDHPDVDV